MYIYHELIINTHKTGFVKTLHDATAITSLVLLILRLQPSVNVTLYEDGVYKIAWRFRRSNSRVSLNCSFRSRAKDDLPLFIFIAGEIFRARVTQLSLQPWLNSSWENGKKLNLRGQLEKGAKARGVYTARNALTQINNASAASSRLKFPLAYITPPPFLLVADNTSLIRAGKRNGLFT